MVNLEGDRLHQGKAEKGRRREDRGAEIKKGICVWRCGPRFYWVTSSRQDREPADPKEINSPQFGVDFIRSSASDEALYLEELLLFAVLFQQPTSRRWWHADRIGRVCIWTGGRGFRVTKS